MNINWILPTLFGLDEYTICLDDICKKNGLKNPLKYVYGTIRCDWAYNFDSFMKFEDKKYLNTILSSHFEKNLTPIINFSNTNITKTDLNNVFCNYYLDLSNEYNCELIVGSDLLFDYIKNKYPDKIISSSVNKPMDEFQEKEENPEKELEYYNNLALKYDKVIIRPEFTKYLEQGFIPEKKEKMIVILNNACKNNCQYFKNCRNIENEKFICIRSYERKISGIDKSLEDVSMMTQEQLNNVVNLGINNVLLKDNKQALMFLYAQFNNCLFDNYSEFVKIDEQLGKAIRQMLISQKFDSVAQNLLINFLIIAQKEINSL